MRTCQPGDGDERALKKLAQAANSCIRNLKPEDGDDRKAVHARLQELGEWAVPGCTIKLFGSTACELHAHGADLDFTLLHGGRGPAGSHERPPSYAEQQALVRHLAQAFQPLEASGEFTLVEAIDRARVPILKLQHAASGLQCDLSIGNDLAVRKTRLLHAYVQRDNSHNSRRMQSLCLLVKYCAPPHASCSPTPLPSHSRPTLTTLPLRATGAKRRDLTFRVKRTGGCISFHGAFNSYAWVRRSCSQPAVAPLPTPTLTPISTQTPTQTPTQPLASAGAPRHPLPADGALAARAAAARPADAPCRRRPC